MCSQKAVENEAWLAIRFILFLHGHPIFEFAVSKTSSAQTHNYATLKAGVGVIVKPNLHTGPVLQKTKYEILQQSQLVRMQRVSHADQQD